MDIAMLRVLNYSYVSNSGTQREPLSRSIFQTFTLRTRWNSGRSIGRLILRAYKRKRKRGDARVKEGRKEGMGLRKQVCLYMREERDKWHLQKGEWKRGTGNSGMDKWRMENGGWCRITNGNHAWGGGERRIIRRQHNWEGVGKILKELLGEVEGRSWFFLRIG